MISQHVIPLEGAPASALGAGGRSRPAPRELNTGAKPEASHRREREATRRRGSQRDRSLTVSPGPEAFPEGTLENRVGAHQREQTVAQLSLCTDFASGRLGCFPFGLARAAARFRGERREAGAASRVGTTS